MPIDRSGAINFGNPCCISISASVAKEGGRPSSSLNVELSCAVDFLHLPNVVLYSRAWQPVHFPSVREAHRKGNRCQGRIGLPRGR